MSSDNIFLHHRYDKRLISYWFATLTKLAYFFFFFSLLLSHFGHPNFYVIYFKFNSSIAFLSLVLEQCSKKLEHRTLNFSVLKTRLSLFEPESFIVEGVRYTWLLLWFPSLSLSHPTLCLLRVLFLSLCD